MEKIVICSGAPPVHTCWPRVLCPANREGVRTVLQTRHEFVHLVRGRRFSSSHASDSNAMRDVVLEKPKRPAFPFCQATKEKPYALVKQPEGASAGLFHYKAGFSQPFAVADSAVGMELSIRQHRQAGQPTFYVRRTASENIPVYLRWKNKRNKVSTVLRKTRGDKQALKAELATLCQAPVVDAGGYIEVMGNHQQLIKQWLKEIGF